MPRIRTIKPEFWTNDRIVECSTNARLLFVGMWNFCDDGGVHPSNARRLKMEVFPGDDFTISEIEAWIDELIDQKLLVEFEAEVNTASGTEPQTFWYVTGWAHQKIDRPNLKYPQFDDRSTTIRRTFDDQSPPEGKGKESKGKEGKGDSPFVEDSTNTLMTDFVFPITGGKKSGAVEWSLPLDIYETLASSYPAVNLDAELRKAVAWCTTNTTNRKTARGMASFLNRWMAKQQDRGSPPANSTRKPRNRSTAELMGGSR